MGVRGDSQIGDGLRTRLGIPDTTADPGADSHCGAISPNHQWECTELPGHLAGDVPHAAGSGDAVCAIWDDAGRCIEVRYVDEVLVNEGASL